MSRYALSCGIFVDAVAADPLGSFSCSECGGPLHLRRARGRIAHFVHMRATPACRLYSRAARHLEMQLSLKNWIPALEVECPFPDICRIADLYWRQEKIVFEIQCSRLTEPQVTSRIADYGKLGIRVVWLLDDRLFFKRAYKEGEQEMRRAGYYVSLPLRVYDAWECPVDRWRRWKGSRFSVELNRPREAPIWEKKDPIPELLRNRSGAVFWGDLRDRAEGWLKTEAGRKQLERWQRQERMFRWRPVLELPRNGISYLLEEFEFWITS